MNTSTPKKPSDVKMAMNEARSSFFGLDDTNYDNVPPVSPIRGAQQPRRDSQMDTADMLENCTEGDSGAAIIRMGTSDGSEENYRTCDINNNNDQQQKRNSNKESESGLGSISAASDEPDAKQCPEKALLLDDLDAEEDEGIQTNNNNGRPRNIIREPQYYSNKPNPTQVSKAWINLM